MDKNPNSQFLEITSLPKKWLHNIIYIQEKKSYNFYVVLIFACFVSLMRISMEFIFSHRPMMGQNIATLNHLTFYLHCIFIYTFVLSLFIPDFKWKASIHLVLIGVFLGILPPIIDSFFYELGDFSYGYVSNVFEDWKLLIYTDQFSVPVGEALVLFITMAFTSLVIYIKTASLLKTALSFITCYLAVMFYAGLLPTLALSLSKQPAVLPVDSVFLNTNILMFSNFNMAFWLTFFQIFTCVVIYLLLNPHIFRFLIKRSNHAIPGGLTCLLGYSLYQSIDWMGVLMAFLVVYAGFVTIIQNDYFDRVEDEADGREGYLCLDDVKFFNTSLFLIIALLAFAGHFSAYMLLLFFMMSYIYNYDFYRGKKYFPSNYKIEGIFGFSAFMAGVGMAFSTKYGYGGDVLNIGNLQTLSPAIGQMMKDLGELWTFENIMILFFVFGGWSIISVIKDYKDIESDREAGNQTAYTLLLKYGKDISKFHKRYTLCLSILMLIPALWLIEIGSSLVFIFCLLAIIVLFYFSINREPKNSTVSQSLALINIYIFNIALAFHLSHF